jgi:hypothetical protein
VKQLVPAWEPGAMSAHMSDFYSIHPKSTWGVLACEFIQAQGSADKLHNWTNGRAGLPNKKTVANIQLKHLLRLRHESQALAVGGTHNDIVLLNSHDGTSSYRLMAGVFRLVCGNGMVVADNILEDIRIPHKGDVAGLVLDGCISILENLPQVSESIREMESIRLSPPEETACARAALIARYGDDAPPITAADIVRPRRRDDAENTVWQTLNRAQENLIRGGVSYIQRDESGRRVARRRTREVGGIDQNTNINRALWALAEEMKKLKTA